jgi:hypothetical protein
MFERDVLEVLRKQKSAPQLMLAAVATFLDKVDAVKKVGYRRDVEQGHLEKLRSEVLAAAIAALDALPAETQALIDDAMRTVDEPSPRYALDAVDEQILRSGSPRDLVDLVERAKDSRVTAAAEQRLVELHKRHQNELTSEPFKALVAIRKPGSQPLDRDGRARDIERGARQREIIAKDGILRAAQVAGIWPHEIDRARRAAALAATE